MVDEESPHYYCPVCKGETSYGVWWDELHHHTVVHMTCLENEEHDFYIYFLAPNPYIKGET